MYTNDAFSKWLGIEKLEISKGSDDIYQVGKRKFLKIRVL